MIPYAVSAYTHHGQEINLIHNLDRSDQAYGSISRPSDVREIELMIRGSEGSLRHKYICYNHQEKYTPVLYEEIHDKYQGRIPQDDTDSIMNGETKFFVFTDDTQWGFYVLPVARSHEALYLGQKQFFPFESEESELDFFDGLK